VSQEHEEEVNGVKRMLLHPCGYFSRRMTGAELNYTVHDKELLAIIESIVQWHYQFRDNEYPVDVVTDHRNLEYFMEKRQLGRRHARWWVFLNEYRLVIRYRPGIKAIRPDALSRREDYHPEKGSSLLQSENPGNFTALLPQGWGPDVTEDFLLQRSLHVRETKTVGGNLERKLREGVLVDETLRKLHQLGRSVIRWRPDGVYGNAPHVGWSRSGLLCYQGRFAVPDYKNARLQILQNRHDTKATGHPGETKTRELVTRTYWWPRMTEDIRDYVQACYITCVRSKAKRHAPYGLLKSLPIPTRPWDDITMDFITGLPESQGYDSVLIILDRLTKMAIYLPTTKRVTAEDLARLYVQHVFSKHGIPKTIVSDRGTQFDSAFWREFIKILGADSRYSTAYHPQTDGQTERVNQELESYLRSYISFLQDDWVDYLPMAEFARNNSVNSTTKVTPFFANHGYHPWLSPAFRRQRPRGGRDLAGGIRMRRNPSHGTRVR
jgi:transposase InsO family protein